MFVAESRAEHHVKQRALAERRRCRTAQRSKGLVPEARYPTLACCQEPDRIPHPRLLAAAGLREDGSIAGNGEGLDLPAFRGLRKSSAFLWVAEVPLGASAPGPRD